MKDFETVQLLPQLRRAEVLAPVSRPLCVIRIFPTGPHRNPFGASEATYGTSLRARHAGGNCRDTVLYSIARCRALAKRSSVCLYGLMLWRGHLIFWPFYLVLAVYVLTRAWKSATPVGRGPQGELRCRSLGGRRRAGAIPEMAAVVGTTAYLCLAICIWRCPELLWPRLIAPFVPSERWATLACVLVFGGRWHDSGPRTTLPTGRAPPRR
jgi:hypothetical protein